jgi:hypothetical protein
MQSKDLIRIFVPIYTRNPPLDIGTIEAGHHISRKSFIEIYEVYMVQALAQITAVAMKNILLKYKGPSTLFNETVKDILNGK